MSLAPKTRRDRGATIPIVALLLPVLILMVAFAIDLGVQRSNRRTMQARADIIALDMIRLADGRTEAQILADPGYLTLLNGSAQRNEVPVSALTVEYGTWNGSQFFGILPDGIPSAVQVVATQEQDYFFQPGSGTVTRSAVATADALARLRLGSFAARISTGSSPLLGSVLGDALSTSVVGYEGLLSSDINLPLLASALDLGSPDAALGTTITLAELYTASADALRNDPDSDAADLAAADFFDVLAASVPADQTVQLGQIIGAETGGGAAALTGTVNAFDLLSGSALVANGTNALTVPALTFGLPGLLQVGTPCNGTPTDDETEVCSALSVIQGPITFTGHPGTSRSNKQARTRLGLSGGPGGLATASTQVDVSVAPSTATIRDISCGSPRTISARVTTGLTDVSLRIAVTVGVTIPLLGSFGVPVVITVDRPPSPTFEDVVFTEQPDGTWTPAVFEAGTQDLGAGGLTTNIEVAGGFLPVVTNLATTLANGLLGSITGPLLTAVETGVTPLMNQLGLNLAGADLSALAAFCETPKLVD